jgi:hypothetical protein
MHPRGGRILPYKNETIALRAHLGTITPVNCSTSGRTEEPSRNDDTEIEWHRDQLAKNRALLEELEAGNGAGGNVFPETQSQIDHVKAQITQSELIVAAHEKGTL